MQSATSATVLHGTTQDADTYRQPINELSGRQGSLAQFFANLLAEFNREIHLDCSKSDMLVEGHVNGLIILLFAMSLLFVVASYGVLGLAFSR